MNIMEWLDKEQEHKLIVEYNKHHQNRFNDKNKLNRTITRMDLDFIKLRNSGVKNLHPIMIKRLSNII